MTLDQNGFDNNMDLFKTQLQVATSLFYRMSTVDQMKAFQLLKEIVEELQVVLSSVQDIISSSVDNEVKLSANSLVGSEPSSPSSKPSSMLEWKMPYTESHDMTQLLEEERDQPSFTMPVPQGDCIILQENVSVKSNTDQLDSTSRDFPRKESEVEEISAHVSAEKMNSDPNNLAESSLNTTLALTSYQNKLLEALAGETPVPDANQNIENTDFNDISQSKESEPLSENVLDHNVDQLSSLTFNNIDKANKSDSFLKLTSHCPEFQQSDYQDSINVNNVKEVESCDAESPAARVSSVKMVNVKHRKRKRKYEHSISTRTSQRLASKRQKLKQVNITTKVSQKHFHKEVPFQNLQTLESDAAAITSMLQVDVQESVKSVETHKESNRLKSGELSETKQTSDCETLKETEVVHETMLVACRYCRLEFPNVLSFKQHHCKESSSLFCEKCHLNFSHPQHYQKHISGHSRNNCKICNAQFAKRKALCRHMKCTHKILEAEKLYECSYCDRKFIKRPSLYVHLKEHAGGKLVCLKCGSLCDTKEQYEKHMMKHSEESKYHCTKCSECFFRKQQFEQHMLGHEKYDCNVCNLSFSTKKLLLKHQRIVHYIYSHEDKKHECNICKKKFQRPMLLEIHMRLHTGERPIQCTHCEKNFRTPKALAKHLKTSAHLKASGQSEEPTNELEKSFLCAECGAKFNRKQGLYRHMQQLHSDERPYVCPYCEYSCKCKTNLKRHIGLHTNKKKYICEVCGASFHARATLKEHHAYVHSEVRSFVCSDCGKGFKGRSGLRRHLRIHSDARPYVCSCGQSYKRMSHLKRHMISIHGSTFKSKRVSRILEENSSSKSDELSLTSENLENDPTVSKTIANECNSNAKLKETDQDKSLPSDTEVLSFKVQKAIVEMLQNISVEQAEPSGESNNVITENPSLHPLLTLTSNQGMPSSNSLHIIHSSALECSSDIQFSFSSNSSDALPNEEKHQPTNCAITNQISLPSNVNNGNKFVFSTNGANTLISTNVLPNFMDSNVVIRNVLGSGCMQLLATLNPAGNLLPSNSSKEELSPKCMDNSNSDSISKFTDNNNPSSNLENLDAQISTCTTSVSTELIQQTELPNLLPVVNAENHGLSVTDVNDLLVQSVKTHDI